MSKALVITFDRLALRMLGCHGSDWVETPNFDRLAAQSIVFDRHFAENVGSEAKNHAWWNGCYQFPRSDAQQQSQQTLAEVLNTAGIRTSLLVESTSKPPSCPTGFQHIIDVTGMDGLDVPPAETPFAQLVARSIEELNRLKEQGGDSWLVWLKSAGVPTPWIPPRDFAELYLDFDEDTTENNKGGSGQFIDLSEEALDELILAVASLNSPAAEASELSDLEWRLSRSVYAGYVSMLDIQLGKLLDAFEKQFANESILLIVTASMGESLGTTSTASPNCEQLCDEIVHTSLICRILGRETQGRSQSLVNSVDLPPTLLEWFNVPANALPTEGQSLLPQLSGELTQQREYICMGDGKGSSGILTSELYFIRTECEPAGFNDYLFVKPDDVWDIQNVAKQSPDDVKALSETLENFIQQARTGCPLKIPDLVQPQERN